MPTRFPITASDIKVWGMVMNDALAPILANEHIYIVPNGNNPPTVKAGTSFLYHATETYLTPLTPATGNIVYPVNTNITYLAPTSVNEPIDRTFAFGASGGLIADITKENSTIYYVYTTGAEDINTASKGRGLYGLSKVAPAFDDIKKQWWITGVGRALCRFYVDSGGNVLPGSLCHYTSKLVAELYTTTTGAPSITGLNIIKDDKTYIIEAELNHTAAGSNTNIYLRTNDDGATDANWYSVYIYNTTLAGAGQNSALLYYQPANYTAEKHQLELTIKYMAGKAYYNSKYAINQDTANSWAVSYGNLKDASTLTTISTVALAIAGGAWVAGSDIRIYRGR